MGRRGPDKQPRSGARTGKPSRTKATAPRTGAALSLRERALRLLVEGKTVREVAQQVGRSERAVYHWLQEEAFAAELARRHEDLRETALRRLRGRVVELVDALVAVARGANKEHGPKCKAAIEGLAILGISAKTHVQLDVRGGLDVSRQSDEELEALIQEEARKLTQKDSSD